MIKINLLNEPDDSETIKRATYAGAGASFVGIILLGVLQLFFAKSEIVDTKKKLGQLKTELAQLKEQTQEVQELEKLKNELEQTAKAILSVKFKQIGPSRFFQDLIAATPERVWLSGAEENEPGVLTVKGYALNDFSLASFLKNLEQYEYIASSDLKSSLTSYLTKVITYDTEYSAYSFLVAPADKINESVNSIKNEAKARGIKVYAKPPPQESQQVVNGANPNTTQGTANGGSERLVGWGRFMKPAEGIYVWNLSEGTEAKSFIINIKYDFLKMNGLTQKNTEVVGKEASPS